MKKDRMVNNFGRGRGRERERERERGRERETEREREEVGVGQRSWMKIQINRQASKLTG